MRLKDRAAAVISVFALVFTNIGVYADNIKDTVSIPNWRIAIVDSKGYAEVVNDEVHTGNSALHIVKTTPKDGSYKYITVANKAPVEKDKTYAYGCWIKADKAMQINMWFTSNGMENMSALGHTWDWKRVEFKVTSDRDNTAQEVGFNCYGAARNVWIDDVYIYELDEDGNYVGENLIANNPGFESGSTDTAAASANERVVVRDKTINNAEDYLSVSNELPLFRSNIAVDGDLSDWNDITAVDFLRYYKMINYTGDVSITATLKTAYDDKNFYFLVQVTDPIHFDKGMYYWSSDSLQFMLSSQEGTYGEEIGIQYIADANPYCTHDNIMFNTGRNGDVTYYEVAVPWGTYIPEEPDKFWFNAVLNNNDGADRIYCHELAEGIASGKNADKAKTLLPMPEGDKIIAYLSSGKKNVMLPDEELNMKLSVINLGDTAELDITLPEGKETVKLNANSYTEKDFSVTDHVFGNNTVNVDIIYPNKTEDIKYQYTALPDEATVNEYCDKYTDKIAELREKAGELNKSKIVTDYEDIELNMAERSVEVIKRLQAQGDYDVVVYNINALEDIFKSIEANLDAYKDGTKEPRAVPKIKDGRAVINGNSFYGKTVIGGQEEIRPVFLSNMNFGWEDRDELPVWKDLGFNTVSYSIAFGDVVGQAGTPTIWKKQRGTVAYSDTDIEVTDEEAHSGKYSLKYVNRTAAKTGYGTYMYQTFKPEPNTKYTLSFSAKGNLNGMKVSFGNAVTLSGIADDWKDYSVSWTAGDAPASTNVVVLSGDITDGAYIDDIKLCKEGSETNLVSNQGFEKYYKQWENSDFGVDYNIIDDACDYLRRAEFYDIKVIFSMLMHTPNNFVLQQENVRDSTKSYTGFVNFNMTAPKSVEAIKIFYRAVLPKIVQYDSLTMIQTHNEPNFNTVGSEYYKTLYHEFLKNKYNTIENLNESYSSEYKAFEEIEMPKKAEQTMYFYDWQVFNESVLTEHFKNISELIEELAPGIPYSAKYMAETSTTIANNTLFWGINYEDMAKHTTMAGNDAFAYLGNGTVQTKLLWYDIQHSLTGTPVADWEDHIIIDHKTINLDPRQYNWLVTTIWQGGMHYVGVDTVWLWGINDTTSNGDFRNTTMQYRADCMQGIANTMSDINRLYYEVNAMRDKTADVGLFYSHCSRTLDVSHTNAFYESYCNTMYNGYKPFIITESNADDMNNYKVLVIPEAFHASRETVEKVISYAKGGGHVIILGENGFKYDLNNNPHPRELTDELYSLSDVVPTATQPGDKRTAIAEELFGILSERYDSILKPQYKLVDAETGEKVKNMEWLAVEYNGGVIVNILNYEWNAPKKVKLIYENRELKGENLLNEEAVGDEYTVEPYTPVFVRYQY